MADKCETEMRVYGKRQDLDIFKTDMAGDLENGPLSFQNIIPEPQDTSEWEGAFYWSGSQNWKGLNWGCLYDAIFPEVNDEGEYLFYTFLTDWGSPLQIYEILGAKYSALNFEFFIKRIVDENIGFTRELQIAYKKGELIKKICMYQEFASWKKNQFKILHYREDILNDTLQVIKEEIYDEAEILNLEDYDDLESVFEILSYRQC